MIMKKVEVEEDGGMHSIGLQWIPWNTPQISVVAQRANQSKSIKDSFQETQKTLSLRTINIVLYAAVFMSSQPYPSLLP